MQSCMEVRWSNLKSPARHTHDDNLLSLPIIFNEAILSYSSNLNITVKINCLHDSRSAVRVIHRLHNRRQLKLQHVSASKVNLAYAFPLIKEFRKTFVII